VALRRDDDLAVILFDLPPELKAAASPEPMEFAAASAALIKSREYA
jgi:hypothetical protein